MKKIFLKIKTGFKNNTELFLLAIPFLLMDLITRIMGFEVDFFPAYYPVPTIFSITWIILFVGIATSLKGIFGKILYWVFFGLSFILFLTNNIYYSLTSFFFSFHLLKLTDEGSSYILDTILGTNPLVYILALIVLIISIFLFKKYKEVKTFNKRRFVITIVLFLILHTITPFLLGSANKQLKWNNFSNPRNVYNEFSDFNRSMKVSGLYEYSIRNLYVTFLKPSEKISKKDDEFLSNIYSAKSEKSANKYTGMLKGKNLIFLQLEGLDDWVFNKDDTPNLYSLLDHSINFTDHYSLYTGGGSTFNSEFAVNTGFTTPISYVENVYSFNRNTFPHTMARIFKDEGYSVNAFHMNSSDFYSRGVNYQSWGYDNYYGLIDIQKYDNDENELDRELILNKTFYEKMFMQKGQPFVNYIITYTPHTPFTTKKDVGRVVAKKYYGENNIPDLSEEECVRLQVKETDYMVGLLIQALKDNGLYDNTVIVAYADHYLYTIKDKSILDKYKTTENNLINHTPFFIWSSDMEKSEISKVNMQTDILPTVLNLFGMDYNKHNYIGNDILDDSTKGYAFFPDYTWYDGNVYVEDSKITNDGSLPQIDLLFMNNKIQDVIRQNDLTLKYDYFKNTNGN